MKTILFALYFSCLLIVTARGHAYAVFECPEDRKIGEPWFQKHCEKCECINRGLYHCVGCGAYGMPSPRCYQVNTPGNYPDCCEPRFVCEGDEDFDESLLKQ